MMKRNKDGPPNPRRCRLAPRDGSRSRRRGMRRIPVLWKHPKQRLVNCIGAVACRLEKFACVGKTAQVILKAAAEGRGEGRDASRTFHLHWKMSSLRFICVLILVLLAQWCGLCVFFTIWFGFVLSL